MMSILSFAGQMRVKGVLLLLLCIFVTSIFYCLVGEAGQKTPPSTLGELVSETHRKLSEPLIKLKQVVVPAVAERSSYYLNNNYNDREDDRRTMESLGERYLRKLGFVDPPAEPRSWPKDAWTNATLPVFVTGAKSAHLPLLPGFVKSLQDAYPEATLLLYDLGLGSGELISVSQLCNTSSLVCVLRKFRFGDYPSHLSDLNLGAYRALILQEVLDQAGAAIWLDPSNFLRPGPGSAEKIRRTLSAAQTVGLLSWPTGHHPTTALTHPRMFDYFHTLRENYYFHRMVDPDSALVVYNTPTVHEKLMLPWVRCALILDCISPIGAQSSGCRFDKKPLYRYSGCHKYDASALNVILGYVYNYSVKGYAGDEGSKFFRAVSLSEMKGLQLSEEADYEELWQRIRASSDDSPPLLGSSLAGTRRRTTTDGQRTAKNGTRKGGAAAGGLFHRLGWNIR